MKLIKIYTDGGYRAKSKLGAYSFIVIDDTGLVEEKAKCVPESPSGIKVTNNTMELTAVIQALKYINGLVSNGLSTKECYVYLWTDSQYVQLGLTQWINNWKSNGWRTASNKRVLNKNLWIELDNLYLNLSKKIKSFSFQWVEGHNGNEYNERADEMCNEVMDNYIINVKS